MSILRFLLDWRIRNREAIKLGRFLSSTLRYVAQKRHTDVLRCFQYKDSGAGELGCLRFAPRYLAAHVEFCKFSVLSRYVVSICMNVPSQAEILLL